MRCAKQQRRIHAMHGSTLYLPLVQAVETVSDRSVGAHAKKKKTKHSTAFFRFPMGVNDSLLPYTLNR